MDFKGSVVVVQWRIGSQKYSIADQQFFNSLKDVQSSLRNNESAHQNIQSNLNNHHFYLQKMKLRLKDGLGAIGPPKRDSVAQTRMKHLSQSAQ